MTETEPFLGLNWNTIFISVIGAAFVSWYSINKQVEAEREREIKKEKEDWYHQVISTCRWTRAKSYNLAAGYKLNPELTVDESYDYEQTQEANEVLEELQDLLEELFELNNRVPPEVPEGPISTISELNHWINNLPEEDKINTTELETRLIDDCEDIIDQCVEESERYEDRPY
jgi:hypothetical protein